MACFQAWRACLFGPVGGRLESREACLLRIETIGPTHGLSLGGLTLHLHLARMQQAITDPYVIKSSR